MKKYLFLLLILASLSAQMPMPSLDQNQKIGVQNAILVQINGKAISVMDVKKKMDVAFHQHYPHLEQSNAARYQFYETSWRHVLKEMIDQQLILADAKEKEIKLTDGEIREELEERFGPHVMSTLDKIGLSYNDAWEMVKNDIIVRRMNWWFIHMKAISKVTPQDIRRSFHCYLKENPPYQEMKYRVISIRGEEAESKIEQIFHFLAEHKKSPESIQPELKAIDPSIQISQEFTAKDNELSEAHKTVLSSLEQGQYSAPIVQNSKTENKTVARIFYLCDKTDFPAPDFTALSSNLREQLTQQAVIQESTQYLDKLRKQYGFDDASLKDVLSDHLHPFSLE